MSSHETKTDGGYSFDDLIKTVTSIGNKDRCSDQYEYVIHTHSIPLASVLQQALSIPSSIKLRHGFNLGDPDTTKTECVKKTCMFVNAKHSRNCEEIPSSCPCNDIKQANGDPLLPRCFLAYIKHIGNLLSTENKDSTILDSRKIVFCENANNLFSNNYPRYIRDRILGASSWLHINETNIIMLMKCTYWFAKHNTKLKLSNCIAKALDEFGLDKTKYLITQSIHTLDGLIVKKLLAFAPETVRYQDFAQISAYLFRDLFEEYSRIPLANGNYIFVPYEKSIVTEIKNYCNNVKETFHHMSNRERRYSWLDFKFDNPSLKRFFSSEHRDLKAMIHSKFQAGQDYTTSLVFIYRCTCLVQTRGLGYLPESIAVIKQQQFRDSITRKFEKIEPSIARFNYAAVQQELQDHHVPYNLLNLKEKDVEENQADMIHSAISSIGLTLKPSASIHHYVREGGKLEDARQLIRLAVTNKWEIPVFDLKEHKLLEKFCLTEDPTVEGFCRPLFWLSYVIITNFLSEHLKIEKYNLVLENGELYEPDPFGTVIIHISEMFKERNLTKTTGFLTWFLTPASKVLQQVLSTLPEHRAGLTEGNHEWRHQKRISALSEESSFMYDGKTEAIRSDIIHSFKDWTESTDYISKAVGWSLLKGLMDFIGFPKFYQRALQLSITIAQPVTECVRIRRDGEEQESIDFNGFISEGFMMGNPITKTILHLVHVSEKQFMLNYLSSKGIKLVHGGSVRTIQDRTKINSELIESVENTVASILHR
jgi:hypothetical protein